MHSSLRNGTASRRGVAVPQLVYSGSEAGSCLRLIDFVYHSTVGLRVIKKKKKKKKKKLLYSERLATHDCRADCPTRAIADFGDRETS